MKKVTESKNLAGKTVRVYAHSASEISRGASHGFKYVIVAHDGQIARESNYFGSKKEALQAAWLK